MKNFIFKSTAADLQKIIQQLNNNIVYVTHQVDFIRKQIMEMKHDKDLQSTVDKYFDETSHQTDSDEQ